LATKYLHPSGVLNRIEGKKEPITLLIHHPSLPPRCVDQPVSRLDIAPTIAELLGIERGANWLGDSLLATGPRRVALPDGATLTLDPSRNEVILQSGDGSGFVQYSASLLNGGAH